jgi:GDP-L-fucose synthase
MEKDAKIFVAGHRGLVGSAIVRKLRSEGYNNLILRTHSVLDLTRQRDVEAFFEKEKPEYVFLSAAKVGGILANSTYKADFIYNNMMIAFNIIHASYLNKVKKLLFLGSSCIYPKNCPQPIKEEYLLTGSLEETNEPYALAKISGLKMCDYYREQYGCNFISAMPTNLYGPNDNYNLETSHVLPAMIRKIHLAKCLEQKDFTAIKKDFALRPYSVKEQYSDDMTEDDIIKILNTFGINIINSKLQSGSDGLKTNNSTFNKVALTLWGSGSPYREFLYVDDLSDALLFLMNNYSDYNHVNVGTGKDLSIKELAEIIKDIIGFKGNLKWDSSKPNGTPRKLLDVSELFKTGWSPSISLTAGIEKVYESYIE